MSTILDFKGSPFGSSEDPPFKKGSPAKHELGVSWQGPYAQVADGFNEHCRRSSRALYDTGCPVHLRSAGPAIAAGAPKALPERIAPLLTASVSQYSIQIHQTILIGSAAANITGSTYMTPDELRMVNSRRVIYSVWERNMIDPDTARALNRCGQVWTACRHNAEMLRCNGVDPSKVKVVPIPFFSDDPLLTLNRLKRKPGPPRFYNISKYEPRKAQESLIAAFMRAFKPGEAHLVLKSSTLTRPIPDYSQGPGSAIMKLIETDQVVRANGWQMGWQDSIEIMTDRLSESQIVSLHKFGDIYLSLSRGEGFDMPAFDAKLSGNMMVYTPSGGPQDFASKTDVMVPPTGTVPCHSWYQWEPESRYLDYDIDTAGDAMRSAAAKLGPVKGHNDLQRFSAENVGREMLHNLQEITPRIY